MPPKLQHTGSCLAAPPTDITHDKTPVQLIGIVICRPKAVKDLQRSTNRLIQPGINYAEVGIAGVGDPDRVFDRQLFARRELHGVTLVIGIRDSFAKPEITGGSIVGGVRGRCGNLCITVRIRRRCTTT